MTKERLAQLRHEMRHWHETTHVDQEAGWADFEFGELAELLDIAERALNTPPAPARPPQESE